MSNMNDQVASNLGSKSTPENGVPPSLTLQAAQNWVLPRVTEKRYRHIAGVAAVAKQLAEHSDCDPYLAELAAWLHDACKEHKDKELLLMAQQQGMVLDSIESSHPHLLHGPIAALVVQQELAVTNHDVLDAISQHTLGAVPMTELSKVVFLADCLEPGRPKDYTDPIWSALDVDGAFSLNKAIVVACNLNIAFLISDNKPIHPRTVETRNYYLDAVRFKT